MILSPFHSTLHCIASQYGIMYRFGLTTRSIFSRFRILTTYSVYSTIQERRLCIIPFAQCFFHIGLIIKHSGQYPTGHGRAASVSCRGWMPQTYLPYTSSCLFIHPLIDKIVITVHRACSAFFSIPSASCKQIPVRMPNFCLCGMVGIHTHMSIKSSTKKPSMKPHKKSRSVPTLALIPVLPLLRHKASLCSYRPS
jgi:hypothetical protein